MPATYTAKRRLLMQAVMIAILAATLGLAAIVKRSRVVPGPPTLGASVAVGVFEIAIPAGWRVSQVPPRGRIPTAFLQATGADSGHILRVFEHRVDYPLTPEEALQTYHGLDNDRVHLERLLISGEPSVAAFVHSEVKPHISQLLIVVVDRRHVLSVELESPGKAFTPTDHVIFGDVVDSIRRRVPAQTGPASTAPSTRPVPADD